MEEVGENAGKQGRRAEVQITIDGVQRDIAAGATLADALAAFSPYGDEATVARVNGVPRKSVDEPEQVALHEGDVVDIYPLIIGG